MIFGVNLAALCGTGLECCDFYSIQTCLDDKRLIRDKKSSADSLCLGQLHFYLIAGYFWCFIEKNKKCDDKPHEPLSLMSTGDPYSQFAVSPYAASDKISKLTKSASPDSTLVSMSYCKAVNRLLRYLSLFQANYWELSSILFNNNSRQFPIVSLGPAFLVPRTNASFCD